MTMTTVAAAIAQAAQALVFCASGNVTTAALAAPVWEEVLHRLAKECLPSGSGFDAGTTIDLDRSTVHRLVFRTSFHHMDESGFYDGWTEHVVRVRPTFDGGFDITISGRDRNRIKEYIHDSIHAALCAAVPTRCTFAQVRKELA
jgi:hypothetical protein